MEQSIISLNTNEEVTPYKVHVSARYLDLTRKKLELTRLPHEILLPRNREWEYGTPKRVVEPLVDYWLENYSWRNREDELNNTPQFRTAISLSPASSSAFETAQQSSELIQQAISSPLRIHFVHIRSPRPSAIPLLVIPPFPLTNLTLSTTELFSRLLSPADPDSEQPFHIICPSIPGLGFSDAFTTCPSPITNQSSHLQQTAYLFNTLMLRLGYENYLATSTSSGLSSPAGIDYHLINTLSLEHSENCLGVHIVEPVIEAPGLRTGWMVWMKYQLAKFFHASIFGYTSQDWTSLRTSSRRDHTPISRHPTRVGLLEPNTLSYALTNSPIGILSLVCSALYRASPQHTLSKEQVVDITQLAWLPGPEATMRFFSSCEVSPPLASGFGRCKTAITVFTDTAVYVPVAWCERDHDVVFAQRVEGEAGLLAWERVDVLVNGIRGLAARVRDERLRVRELEGVLVDVGESEGVEIGERAREEEDGGLVMEAGSPDTVVNLSLR